MAVLRNNGDSRIVFLKIPSVFGRDTVFLCDLQHLTVSQRSGEIRTHKENSGLFGVGEKQIDIAALEGIRGLIHSPRLEISEKFADRPVLPHSRAQALLNTRIKNSAYKIVGRYRQSPHMAFFKGLA